MRISDEELLQAMWENQLRLLSSRVLYTYFGGRYGLVADEEFWFKSVSSEHRISRQNITELIGSQQLMKRIRGLCKQGDVKDSHSDSLTFFIDGENAKKAFQEARHWWLEQGVPEGFENGACRTVAMEADKIERLSAMCQNHLTELFPSYQ